MKARILNLSTSLPLIFALASALPPARADSDDGIVRVKSAVPMSEAITRIKADIASKGIKFFSEIDQSKLAADVGIKLRPSTLPDEILRELRGALIRGELFIIN